MSRSHIALVVTLVIQILASLALMTAPVLAPEASQYINIQATRVGVYMSLVYIASMLSSLFSGYLINTYGAIRASQLCLLLCGLGVFVSSFGHAYTIILGALILGIGYGPLTPASSDVLARLAPLKQRSMYFSIKQTGVPIGGACAGLILPYLVFRWNWQVSVYAVCILCLLGVIISQVYVKSLDEIKKTNIEFSLSSIFVPIKAVIKKQNVRRLAMCSLFFTIVQSCLTTYIVTYLTGDLRVSLTAAGIVMFVLQAGGVVGRVMWGVIADRIGSSMKVLAFLGIMMTVCSLIISLLTPNVSIWVVVVLSVIFGATAIGWNGVYLAEVARLAPPGQAGLMTGGTLFFTYFGVVFGPPVFAFVVELTDSFSIAYALLSAMILITSMVLIKQLVFIKKK